MTSTPRHLDTPTVRAARRHPRRWPMLLVAAAALVGCGGDGIPTGGDAELALRETVESYLDALADEDWAGVCARTTAQYVTEEFGSGADCAFELTRLAATFEAATGSPWRELFGSALVEAVDVVGDRGVVTTSLRDPTTGERREEVDEWVLVGGSWLYRGSV